MADDVGSKIDSSMTIHGEVDCSSRVVLEGRLHGSFTGGQLFISRSGQLEGKVNANSIECFGRMVGNIKTKSLDLKSCGSHSGTVETSELKVELGAILDCALQSGIVQSEGEEISGQENMTGWKSQLVDVVEAFSETQRSCCFDIPWSERLDLYDHLLDLLTKEKPLIKIIGEKGSGKTVLAEKLKIDLKEKYQIVQLTTQVGSVTSLLTDVAKRLGVPGDDESIAQSDLLAVIQTFLADGRKKGEKVLLIIDDAQEMYPASMEGLIQLLTGNFGEDLGYLHIILLGTKETEEKMVATIFDYFEDETNCQLHLDPLNIKDTADYLRFCIQTVQLKETSSSISLLPYETINAIHVVSGGNIKMINKYADKAIRAAYDAGALAVTPHFVE